MFKIERTDQSGVFSGVFVPSQPMTSEQTMEKFDEMLKLFCGADPIFGDVIVVTSSRPDVGYDDHPVGSRHASFTCGLPKPQASSLGDLLPAVGCISTGRLDQQLSFVG